MNDRVVTVLRSIAESPKTHKELQADTGFWFAHVSGAIISLGRRGYIMAHAARSPKWHITEQGRAALAELDSPPEKPESPVEVDTRPTLF